MTRFRRGARIVVSARAGAPAMIISFVGSGWLVRFDSGQEEVFQDWELRPA